MPPSVLRLVLLALLVVLAAAWTKEGPFPLDPIKLSY